MSLPDHQHPIAYFCAEFALSDTLPIYAGGLGVLAGDYIKEANDQQLPVIAIGLLYRQGYFSQHISESGHQTEQYRTLDPHRAHASLLKTPHGVPIKIAIPYLFDQIVAQIWVVKVGAIPVYLLDTDLPENTLTQRQITARLYGGDQHTRIKQELILGIGGAKLIKALHLQPCLYHLNEGHSAFAVFEIARQVIQDQKITFKQALHQIRSQIVFTNHTIVPAGNDLFHQEDTKRYLQAFANQADIPVEELIALGSEKHSFSMTTLALNTAGAANAVSQLHGHMAHTVWPNYKFKAITNGVHLPTWVNPKLQQAVSSEFTAESLQGLNPHHLWHLHLEQKQALLKLTHQQTGVHLNPEALTVVWARRFATYKRPALLLHQITLLKQLAANGHRLQMVIAGKAHPHDQPAKQLIGQVHQLIHDHHLEDFITFVPNYDVSLAQTLVAGADIWLNTPIRGQEASGTSGMKAGANGALLVSTNDGWMAEVNWDDVGWIIPDLHTDAHLYRLLETTLLPLFEDRTDQGLPVEWIWRMQQTIKICWTRFSATRMVHQYQEQLYQPLLDRIQK